MPDPLSPAAEALGESVRACRDDLGLSRKHRPLSTGHFLGQVELGHRNISLHNLLKVAAGLGVDPAELVAGLKPPNPRTA